MSEVARRVLAFVRRRRLVGPGDAVLVGTGGGAASLGLLALLAAHREALGLARLAAASVEPDLDEWGDAAERVADVGRAVRAMGVDFYAVRPADQRGAAVAVEAELRSLAEAHGFSRVVLGHTRDDDALGLLAAALSAGRMDALRPLRARGIGGVVRPRGWAALRRLRSRCCWASSCRRWRGRRRPRRGCGGRFRRRWFRV